MGKYNAFARERGMVRESEREREGGERGSKSEREREREEGRVRERE